MENVRTYGNIQVIERFAIVEKVTDEQPMDCCDVHYVSEEHFNAVADTDALGKPQVDREVVFNQETKSVEEIHLVNYLVCNLVEFR